MAWHTMTSSSSFWSALSSGKISERSLPLWGSPSQPSAGRLSPVASSVFAVLNLAKLEELRKDLDVAMESENQHRIESLIRQIESLEALVDG